MSHFFWQLLNFLIRITRILLHFQFSYVILEVTLLTVNLYTLDYLKRTFGVIHFVLKSLQTVQNT